MEDIYTGQLKRQDWGVSYMVYGPVVDDVGWLARTSTLDKHMG